jgi:tetratricopeptide (TPR) repeat protein
VIQDKCGFTLTQRLSGVKKMLVNYPTGTSYNCPVKNESLSLLFRLILVGIILFCFQPVIQDTRISTALNHARYYLKTGQPEEAEIQIQWIKSIEPWQTLPWSDLAMLYLNQEKPSHSIAILEHFQGEKLTDPSALLTLARSYEKVGRPRQMEETLLKLLRLNLSTNLKETTYQLLIPLYLSQNRIEEAFQKQSDLSLLVPDNKDFKNEEVLLSLALNPEVGLQAWKLISGKPAWLEMVGMKISEANLEKNEAVRMLEIGRSFGGINHWDLAEYWMQKAVDTSPDYAEAWAFLAEARQQRGLDGKEQINRALELTPTSPGVRALASIYFRRQNDYVRAISLLQQNISAQPAESNWYLELGSALAQAGKMEDAASAYQKAVELSPLDFAKLTILARFCIEYDYRIKELGLPAAEKAVEMAGDKAEAQDTYGLALMATGATEKANAAFSLALSLNPEYAPTWLHIGQAAISNGDSTLAKEALLKTVKISGNSLEAQIARRLLGQYYLIKVDSVQN